MIKKYIYYFRQSIANRGWLFTLNLLWHEWRGEQDYGINTLQIADLKDIHTGDNHHYQGASYYVIKKILHQIPIEPRNGIFIDIGAGKGRAMAVAAAMQFRQAIGVELAPELCEIMEQNMAKIRHKYPNTQFEVVNEDATAYSVPSNANVLFFFNPFGASVMQKVIDNLQKSVKEYPRPIYVVYANPVYGKLFLDNGFTIFYELHSKVYTEAIIYTY